MTYDDPLVYGFVLWTMHSDTAFSAVLHSIGEVLPLDGKAATRALAGFHASLPGWQLHRTG